MSMSSLGLGLHMGIGTGRGVGLGAGLALQPLPPLSVQRSARGVGGGRRDDEEKKVGEAEGTGGWEEVVPEGNWGAQEAQEQEELRWGEEGEMRGNGQEGVKMPAPPVQRIPLGSESTPSVERSQAQRRVSASPKRVAFLSSRPEEEEERWRASPPRRSGLSSPARDVGKGEARASPSPRKVAFLSDEEDEEVERRLSSSLRRLDLSAAGKDEAQELVRVSSSPKRVAFSPVTEGKWERHNQCQSRSGNEDKTGSQARNQMRAEGGTPEMSTDTPAGEHGDRHDDADDEDEESHTHVEEGSQSQKEGGFQGYGDPQRYAVYQGHDTTHQYDETHEFERAQVSEHLHGYEDAGAHEELYGYDDSQGYDNHQRQDYFDRYGEHEASHGYGEHEEHGNGAERGQKAQVEGHLDEDIQGSEEDNGEGGVRSERQQDRRVYVEETQVQIDTDNLPPARVELMERLCDLVQRLSSAKMGGSLEEEVLDVLNAKVDEMEELLLLAEETAEAEATAEVERQAEAQSELEAQPEEEAEVEAEATPESKTQAEEEHEAEAKTEAEILDEQVNSGYEDDSGRSSVMPQIPSLQVGEQDIRDLASPLPWLSIPFKYSELLSISPSQSHPELAAATNEALEAAKQAAQAQAEMAERVANEAERLNIELAEVVKKLLARKEESDHLHALLIDRAECAATRILDLEQEICDLEDDILANESELRHLRLKIRAVETWCYEFVPPDADPDLFQSIENWKADWVLVRDRMLERKKDRKERRIRLHRAGCVINSLEEKEDGEGTLTSLGGLSMSVSLLGLGRSPRKGRAY
ncbi:hypothetical protein VTI74DRAFT_7192 [Chaetomium olivicolor]